MAQGTRGRLALLGTGLLVCLGCMSDEKPISKPLPKTQMGSTVKPNLPPGNTQFGGGIQQTGGFNPQPRTNTPALSGNGMSPPIGLAPTTPPANNYALVGNNGAQPTYPPNGVEPFPPTAPGANGIIVPPAVPPGATNPYGR